MGECEKRPDALRIGVDLGGTKIEFVALDATGKELRRERVATPRHDYGRTIAAIADGVRRIEHQLEQPGAASVGVGIPGTISGVTHLVKNANSTWLNGKPFDRDLSQALGRTVRCANDANCLAVSEATDGAGAGKHLVFAVILGTGCGGGVAVDGRVHDGRNGVAGEWGHNPLPWMRLEEFPGPPCYCGKRGCMETWISGTGLARDYAVATGKDLKGEEIVAAAQREEGDAVAAIDRWQNRLMRGLAHIINVLDPDVIVVGGGLSRVARVYDDVPKRLQEWVFGREADTPIVPAKHGDASGVRGAAWLWPI